MITARGLRREFKTKTGTVEAVRGVDLDVAEGELVAFLGPNGAGKSTSVRMLTTLLAPSSGSARVAGFDVVRDPASVRRHIGYVGQRTGSGAYHRVRDELVTQGRAQRLSPGAARARADELLAMFELSELADRDCTSLSGGQKRRLDVALGLMHTPCLLFLDEPTTGLDPHSRANLWQHLLDLHRSRGMTLFVTTHYLEEADGHAERVLIMDHGVLIADDTPARLKANLAGDSVRVEVEALADAQRAAEMAKNVPSARDVRLEGEALSLTLSEGEARLPVLLRELQAAGIAVRRARLTSPTLDDVFLSLTGRSLREAAAA